MLERFRAPVVVTRPSASTPTAPSRVTVTAVYDFSSGTQRQIWTPAYMTSRAGAGGCLLRLAQGAGTFGMGAELKPPFRIELVLRLEGDAGTALTLALAEGDDGRELRVELGASAGRAVLSGVVGPGSLPRQGPRGYSVARRPLQEGRTVAVPTDGSPFVVAVESGAEAPPTVTVAGQQVRWDGPFSNAADVLAAASPPMGSSHLSLQMRGARSVVVTHMTAVSTVEVSD